MSANSVQFSGVYTALVTPFKSGIIDFDSLKRLIHYQLEAGIQGLVVAGSTGEASTLTLEEKGELLRFVVGEVSGRVPILVGSGTNNTNESVVTTRYLERQKPDGFLVLTPYYNKPPQRGMFEHFKHVARATDLPVVLYNVPSRTGVTLLPETVAELAAAQKNIVGVKEAAGDLKVIKKLVELCPSEFLVTSGDDATFVEAISLGARGVISVISHVIPEWCVRASGKNDKRRVLELTAESMDIARDLFCEANPIPVKWALKEMGLIDSSELRLPLVELDSKYYKLVRTALKRMGALQ